jgi:hypothetical protein
MEPYFVHSCAGGATTPLPVMVSGFNPRVSAPSKCTLQIVKDSKDTGSHTQYSRRTIEKAMLHI